MTLSPAPVPRKSERDIDPNVLQARAAKPDANVWVSASAGSGKTKVLTDRILRLLLPREDAPEGTHPEKILALTFTKAGANEMALRLNKRLARWAVMSEADLMEDMSGELLGRKPSEDERKIARRLFAQVVDTPGGLNIMTIHSFCASVLGRFPLEAGLSPQFKALEEPQAEELIKEAQKQVLARALSEKASPLSEALHTISGTLNEDDFSKHIRKLISERRQFKDILKQTFGIEGIYQKLCARLNVTPGETGENLLHKACSNGTFDEQGLRLACKIMAGNKSKPDQEKARDIQNFVDAKPDEKIGFYKSFKKAFLTEEGSIRKAIATKETFEKSPDLGSILETQASLVLELEETIKAANTANNTHALLRLGAEILTAYENLKERRSALDFDDLILKTLALLKGETLGMTPQDIAPWVMYKLDRRIDHILVDEAQDTNPEQWEILKALTEEFFAGSGADENEINRTLFVVGDEKQSIFSFQRAAPEKFDEMRLYFGERINAARKIWDEVPMNISFRSAPAVLDVVDAVYAQEDTRKGMGHQDISHAAFRSKQAGLVELWPLFHSSEEEKTDLFSPPVTTTSAQSGSARLAEHIAVKIKEWVDKDILESHARPVRPGDIMILVNTRNAFVPQMVRALKQANIPVSGVDRMILSEQIAVQDLISAARFALLPEDDLALAELLKSPFIDWNEEDLFQRAYDRSDSLWQAVLKNSSEAVKDWLTRLTHRSGSLPPYSFFAQLLQEPCPADPVSGLRAIKSRLGEEAADPLDEFLNGTLLHEQDELPSLQSFIHRHENDDAQVKREMEEAGNAVRIMTVHGAKGLQAPIVILPDTVIRQGGKQERFLWPDKTGETIPLLIPNQKETPESLSPVTQRMKDLEQEEYHRKLYVALTRAEDRLYIAGYLGKKSSAPKGWYADVKSAMESMPGIEVEDEILRFSNATTGDPDRTGKDKAEKTSYAAPPEWLRKPAPEEPHPPRPLIPSRPSEEPPAATSPRQKADAYRFRRGLVTHTLLQILPELPPEKREAAAKSFVAAPGRGLPDDMQQSIVQEVMALLTHPDFADVFGPGSLAEVPVTGLLDDHTLISGQIDRLIVKEKEILIVDYKTNRPPPQEEKNIPDIYRRQMQAYAAALSKIYPGRPIRTALIWTDGARMMELLSEKR